MKRGARGCSENGCLPVLFSIAKHNTGEVYRCDVVVSEVEIWID